MNPVNPNNNDRANLKKLLTLIWFSMMALFGVLYFLLMDSLKNEETIGLTEALNNPVSLPFLGVVIIQIFGSIFIPRFIIKNHLATKAVQSKPSKIFFTQRIIAMALTESVGIMGFVLGLTVKSLELAQCLIVAAALLMLKLFPSEANISRGLADINDQAK